MRKWVKDIFDGQRRLIPYAVCCLLVSALFAEASANKPSEPPRAECPEIRFLADDDFFPALTQAIDASTREIFICMFSFKAGVHPRSYPDRLIGHLSRACRRGVQIKVILESTGQSRDSLSAQNLKTKELLEKIGAAVYMDSPKRTTHAKMIVIDGRQVFLGSHNFTSSALKYNREGSVQIRDEALAQTARRYMLSILEEAP
ncbi:MAG TPA: phospholipase D-like domain-containing protein [Smithellaceae bacterium]|nr:phospholipase D-like domain-containing protein [Smithellaceae bacterium]